MATRPKNLDLSQLAKRIVDEAAGDEPQPEPPPEKSAKAVRAGTLGGKVGGRRRDESLSVEQRQAIAKKAAAARWKP
jgi:hypothetical protein